MTPMMYDEVLTYHQLEEKEKALPVLENHRILILELIFLYGILPHIPIRFLGAPKVRTLLVMHLDQNRAHEMHPGMVDHHVGGEVPVGGDAVVETNKNPSILEGFSYFARSRYSQVSVLITIDSS